ncbi:MAG: CDP-diacylglycerol--glycerol-3-phosphate 3-phosphatidyltransferase [Halanaerobiales bacterium]
MIPKTNKNVNLPNKLTVLRIILVPIFMGFLLLRRELPVYAEYLALITFILAAITDGLDGYLARKRKRVTKFGKIVDPLADKLLISAALITFVALREISAWAAIIIIGRELAVTGLRVIAASDGIVISASVWGKLKTTIQIAAIIAIILDPRLINFPWHLDQVLIWTAVVVTVYSGYLYFNQFNLGFFENE